MNIRLKKLALKISLKILAFLQLLIQVMRTALLRVARLLAVLWKPIRPVALVIYKFLLVIQQRSRRFFHAQHKFLAIITHRYAIHVFVGVLAGVVIVTNVAQAQSVRSDAFLQQSLLSEIVETSRDQIVTADIIVPTQTSYIDSSAAVKVTPVVEDSQFADVATTTGGTALVGSTVLQETQEEQNTDVRYYTVQEGDTASTIAAKFGVSTKTVLWSNDLSDPDLIAPGDELVILPVTGLSYTVKRGETVDVIAAEFEADAQDIIDFNGYINANDIRAGDEIIIPDGKKADPPPPPEPEPVQVAATTTTTVTPSAPAAAVTNTIPTTTGANAAPVASAGGQWPTTTRRISQYYGYGHTGLDIDGECGDPIYASDSGTVVHAGWNGAYGISVKVAHAGGITTHYAHLQSLSVGAGQAVSRGQYLGAEGTTGRSSGCHLHYEVLRNGGFSNPFSYTQ